MRRPVHYFGIKGYCFQYFPPWGGGGGGGTAWGAITGTLSSQTDLQTALNAKAPLASPTLTGTPAAPTPTANDNSTKIATTAYVDTADALKANLASPALTGNPTAPTQTAGNNSTRLATTAYVDASRAMTLISDQLLGGAAATVTFSSIPATYKHLRLLIEARSSTSATGDTVYFQANADTTLNYAVQQVYGSNATASAGQNLSATADIMEVPAATALAGESGVAECTFVNYAGTTFNKRATVINGATVGATLSGNMYSLIKIWRWGNTAAISGLVVGLASGANFITGSRFTLYGLS